LYIYSQIVLTLAAVGIAMGGLYDALTRRLPPNLQSRCAGNQEAMIAMRELLRALGGSLICIGATVAILARSFARDHDRRKLILILGLVLLSEGVNTLSMYRVRSPYLIPLCFVALTLTGVALGLLGPGV